jgi:hypothetical protein
VGRHLARIKLGPSVTRSRRTDLGEEPGGRGLDVHVVTDSFALYIESKFLEVVPNRETSHASEIGCINERSRITPKFRRLATPEDGPSATAPKAYAPAATAAAQTARATAATVTENLSLLGGCVRGRCTCQKSGAPGGRYPPIT